MRFNPQQAGAQGGQPNAENYAKIIQYISQNPSLLSSVFGQSGVMSSPLAKMALAGALAVTARKFSQQ